ncbi:capsular polysaccharide biosynthesis protein [Paracoccus endophyticus]|uniref:capsular polysaccharide biosynthesis protein n=1 Tax=Paracoccus endophyticus TaxID=2233774 RepID=UPI000DDAE249|nr:capsular polysaccharide biosynthesis protein [Paracoccus endophyticus]
MTAAGGAADAPLPRRLFVANGGFWTSPRVRRILALAGWRVTLGLPGRGDAVGVWGNSPTAWRGRALAARRGAALVTVEDAFLRSILPGRDRSPVGRRGPVGLLIDPQGLHFDPARPSRLETLAASAEAAAMTGAARAALDWLRTADLSKYNAHRPDAPAPPPGSVLVVDQTRGDASLMGAGRAIFLRMLAAARDENPGATIVVRSHPETAAGLRPGHLTPADLRRGEIWCDAPLSPWRLVGHAAAVYAVSSQLGYEALLAGRRTRMFGQPFYAGWGLTDDETPVPRRVGRATVETLFAASHLLGPVWYDPCRDRLASFDGALRQIEAEARAFREDRDGHLAYGMRLWKRPAIARAFGSGRGVRFTGTPSPAVTLAWANRADAVPQAARVEDGFLRSRGLGAALVPPLSLVADPLGIYYDPTRPSLLEALIAAPLPPCGRDRALSLIARLREQGVTKYNLAGALPHIPSDGRRVILVPGQVEDDASIRLGAGAERTNLALLKRVREENPEALIVWKPHPDVEAGLRPGAVGTIAGLADVTADGASAAALIDRADEVWTITSTLGFEALVRGKPVTTLGAPFYAGWGLTRDLGPVPARRVARPDLAALVHAALIAYPRYVDPVSRLPCPVELALDRLADPALRSASPPLRWLAKAQGALAGHSWIWRR